MCVEHIGVCADWMWVVGTKGEFSLVSPSVMPCFWVIFTAFRGVVRHGCGGLVGWQMVLSCGTGPSDRGRGIVVLCFVVLRRCLVRVV